MVAYFSIVIVIDDSVVGRPLKISHESAPDEEVKLFPVAILIVNLKVAIWNSSYFLGKKTEEIFIPGKKIEVPLEIYQSFFCG